MNTQVRPASATRSTSSSASNAETSAIADRLAKQGADLRAQPIGLCGERRKDRARRPLRATHFPALPSDAIDAALGRRHAPKRRDSRRRLRVEAADNDGTTRSQLQELRRRDPVAHDAYVRAFTRDVRHALVEFMHTTNRELRAIGKVARRSACEVRHRRASGARPVRRQGSRRDTTASSGGGDSGSGDRPSSSGDEPPPTRRGACSCPNAGVAS
jgi:hypothetical protein